MGSLHMFRITETEGQAIKGRNKYKIHDVYIVDLRAGVKPASLRMYARRGYETIRTEYSSVELPES